MASAGRASPDRRWKTPATKKVEPSRFTPKRGGAFALFLRQEPARIEPARISPAPCRKLGTGAGGKGMVEAAVHRAGRYCARDVIAAADAFHPAARVPDRPTKLTRVSPGVRCGHVHAVMRPACRSGTRCPPRANRASKAVTFGQKGERQTRTEAVDDS